MTEPATTINPDASSASSPVSMQSAPSAGIGSNELKAKWAEYKPYIVNVKALGAAAVVLYALYSLVTTVPGKIGLYFTAMGAKQEAIKRKDNLKQDKESLTKLLQELKQQTVSPIQVKKDASPELAAIDVAQKIIGLAEAYQNKYVRLESKQMTVINVDTIVALPVALSTNNPQVGAQQATPSPAVAPGTPTVIPPGSVEAFQYTLELNGSYVGLANFIHDLAKMTEFVVISSIELIPNPSGQPIVLVPSKFSGMKEMTPLPPSADDGTKPPPGPGGAPSSGKPVGGAASLKGLLSQAPPSGAPGTPGMMGGTSPTTTEPGKTVTPGTQPAPGESAPPPVAKVPSGPMQSLTMRITFFIPFVREK